MALMPMFWGRVAILCGQLGPGDEGQGGIEGSEEGEVTEEERKRREGQESWREKEGREDCRVPFRGGVALRDWGSWRQKVPVLLPLPESFVENGYSLLLPV